MDLLDAICSTPSAQSVAEYSLSLLFRRSYNSLYKGAQARQLSTESLSHLVAPYLPQPARPFFLLGLDITPCPRVHSFKLEGRECIHRANQIKGSPQITYGHQYSEVCMLPERDSPLSPRWVIPLKEQRVSRQDQEQSGIKQILALLEDEQLPFGKDFCVLVGDSAYSTPTFLHALTSDKPDLIVITRVRSNRHIYSPVQQMQTNRRGHPVWYEDEFALNNPAGWPKPDQAFSLLTTNSRGRPNRTEVMVWHNKVMRGSWKSAHLPMHKLPFTLLKIDLYDEQNKGVFKKPLWLIVIGTRREELSPATSLEAYHQRPDMEHFFRFTKRQMLLTGYQTPVTAHEENWWQLVHLAYLQLWMARDLARRCPYPWQRYTPQVAEKTLSPTMVQRSFSGIIRQFGTPARPPKRRGNSPGRLQGMVLAPRKDQFPVHRCRN